MCMRDAERGTPSAAQVNAALDAWQVVGAARWIPVIGTSMLPTLAAGDDVLIYPDVAAVDRGEIIVFRRGQNLIAHRVVRVDDNTIGTKGDNCALADPPLFREEIIGRVVAIRSGRHIRRLNTADSRRRGRVVATLSDAQGRILAFAARAAKRVWTERPVPGSELATKVIRLVSVVPAHLLIGRPRR